MSKVKDIAIKLLDANADLHQARTEFFDRANTSAYQKYLRALRRVNKLEEEIGCKVEDVKRMVSLSK